MSKGSATQVAYKEGFPQNFQANVQLVADKCRSETVYIRFETLHGLLKFDLKAVAIRSSHLRSVNCGLRNLLGRDLEIEVKKGTRLIEIGESVARCSFRKVGRIFLKRRNCLGRCGPFRNLVPLADTAL